MTIELRPETQRLLNAVLKTGSYASADRAVRDGLMLLGEEVGVDGVCVDEIKSKLAHGVAQAERGELLDPGVVLQKIEQRKLARAQNRE